MKESLPEVATVLLAGDHDDELPEIGEIAVRPFPQWKDGTYAGDPPSSLAAIAQLEAQRAAGADFLLFPASTVWLDELKVFKRHLERRYRLVVDRKDVGLLFALREPPQAPGHQVVDALEDIIAEYQDRAGHEPAILDWATGFGLAERLPHHAIFSPVDPLAVLPYLDRTIDIIVIAADDPIHVSEARRVAAGAVVRIDGAEEGGMPAVRVEWLPEIRKTHSLTVSVIIPVWESRPSISTSLDALSETLPRVFRGEVIVAPDSSIDGKPDLAALGRLGRHARVVDEPQGHGFGATANHGASDAVGDILVFLAGDALPLPGWLSFLLRTFRDHPDAGAVAAKLIYPDGTLQEAGGMIPGERDVEHPAYGYVRVVNYTSSVFLATRRSLFQNLGGFNLHAAPGESLDYCRRVQEMGMRIYFQPEVALVHPAVSTLEGPSSAAPADGQ